MSSYEDYTARSASYDDTRWAFGVEVVLGCLATGDRLLSDVHVVDAGCGTGNYAVAVLPHVAHVTAVDANAAMLGIAGRKLAAAREAGRVTLAQALVDRLPLPDGTIDAVMINQVLHHLDDDPTSGWPAHGRVLAEVARVLRPGGTLVINTSSHIQLHEGCWYSGLIPDAIAALRRRFMPLDDLEARMVDHGLRPAGRFVPVDVVAQGPAYFEADGPLRPGWRAGDSAWALVDDAALDRALAQVRALDAEGGLARFVADNDARRPAVGQVTFVAARRVAR